MSAPRHAIFISYSDKDEVWKDRVASHLGVLAQEGRLEVWEVVALTEELLKLLGPSDTAVPQTVGHYVPPELKPLGNAWPDTAEPNVSTQAFYTPTELLRSLVRTKEAFERFEAVGAVRTCETLEPVWAEVMALRVVADLTPMDQFSRERTSGASGIPAA